MKYLPGGVYTSLNIYFNYLKFDKLELVSLLQVRNIIFDTFNYLLKEI